MSFRGTINTNDRLKGSQNKIRNIKVSNLIHKPKSLKLHIQEIIEYIREIEP
jgi:hypothetical protein